MKVKSLDQAAKTLSTATYIKVPLKTTSTTATLIVSSSTLATALTLDEHDEASSTIIAPTALLSASSSMDITPPVVTLPDLPQIIADNTPVTFDFSTSDDASGVATTTATLDDVAIADGAIIKDIPEGQHTFEVEAVDNAGNPRIESVAFSVAAPTPAENTGSADGGAIIQVTAPAKPHCKKKPTP